MTQNDPLQAHFDLLPKYRDADMHKPHGISGDAEMKTLAIALLFGTGTLAAQIVERDLLLKQPVEAWPTYNGDYSGRRFSTLKQIDQSNIKSMTLAWVTRMTGGAPRRHRGRPRGPIPIRTCPLRLYRSKATPLMVNGVLYFATPDNAWAVDARSGKVIWHYFWKTTGGIHIGKPRRGDLRQLAVLRD